MTDTERLILQGLVAAIDLSCLNAKALGVYHDASARNAQEKIEAALDSQMANEVDNLK
jgi:hypothetical protein